MVASDGFTVGAVLKLPFAVAFEPAAVGMKADVLLAGRSFTLTLPRVAWRGDEPLVVRPSPRTWLPSYLDGFEDGSTYGWGDLTGWNPQSREIKGMWVRAVLFTAKNLEAGDFTYSGAMRGRGLPEGPVVESLFAEVDRWSTRLAEWVEVFSDQDAGRGSPLRNVIAEGQGFSLWTVEGDLRSPPATTRRVVVIDRRSHALSRAQWRRVLRQASLGTTVPDEHRLLIDARAAARRGHGRRAVVDAGTAIELALWRIMDDRLDSTPSPPREELIKQKWTLGKLVELLGGCLPLPSPDIRRLAEIRNRCVHGNHAPPKDDVDLMLRSAQAVVEVVEPLDQFR
jgi:hypothetical protein